LTEQFGKDLFEDETLIPIFEELIGIKETKPFECVGTVWEVRHALNLTLEKYQNKKDYNKKLLNHYQKIDGHLLSDIPTDYETGDLLSETHKAMLAKELNHYETMGND